MRRCHYYALRNLHKRYSVSCGHKEYVNLRVSVYIPWTIPGIQNSCDKLKSLAVSQILPVLNIYRGEVCFNGHVRLNCTVAWSLTTEQLEGDSTEEPRFLCLERRNEIPFIPTVKEQLLKTKDPFLGIIGSQHWLLDISYILGGIWILINMNSSLS